MSANVFSGPALVLAGAGHSHIVTIARWVKAGLAAPPGTVLVSPTSAAWYSGMMPGLIAGRFEESDCAIALRPLCQAAGIELLIDEVTALDADGQTLSLGCGAALGFKWLSLDVGSIPPSSIASDGSVELVPAKPFAAFTRQWRSWQQKPPRRLAVAGGGAAAFELAVALRRSLQQTDVGIISHAPLLAGHADGVVKRARQVLAQRAISVVEGAHVDRLQSGGLYASGKKVGEADALVLATGASAAPWLAGSGLRCDDMGFVAISNTLQSLSHPAILASGDCASLPGAHRSGVYAVRQGPTLAHNLLALANGRADLQQYQPQKQSLALLSTADGEAILSYGRFATQGRLAGLWKDHLDQSFMRRHRPGA